MSAPATTMPDPLALDAAGRAWVDRTLAGLSTEAAIAQLFVLSSREDTLEEGAALAALRPGGIHRFPARDLGEAVAATRRMIESADIPVLLSGDIEGGTASYPFTTALPNQMGIAACDDLALSAAVAEVIARESRALGYDWSFTPVVDLNVAFRNAVVGTRSYGSDVDRVLAQARTYVRVVQAHGLAATAKHWPGDGIDDRDQHLTTTVNPMSPGAWADSFGRIFRQLIADGVMTIMSAHIALPAYAAQAGVEGRERFAPATVSHLLNQRLLREELGFRGLIVSDATVMGGLTSWLDRRETVPAVIAGGCDMFLFSRDAASDMALMLDGLREGRLSEARLEEAVRRVLSFKAALGLHRRTPDERIGSLDDVAAALRTERHREIARVACGQSVTRVKDTQHLLPLDPDRHRRVVVIADAGWTFFAGAVERSFDPFFDAMRAHGFDLRHFDPEAPPTAADTDLLIYLVGQEATPSIGHIHLDFARMHGGMRRAMMQFNREIPTLLLSFGQPYYLRDAANFATLVNAYSSLDTVQREAVARLVDAAPFEGVSPVDAFCGEEQLRW
ncbi:glycoside hydrolase family 3 protein [Sphingomonas hengshuiensis]|nr:glycoside hydrolase family 3 N-terminal domain-containing protein [Sphingomonas hengshuiensis]